MTSGKGCCSMTRKSTLNIHWKDWCWSWSSNTLTTWCEEEDSLEKPLKLEKIESKRRRGQRRMRWLDDLTDSMDMSFSKVRDSEKEIVNDREAWSAIVHGFAKCQAQLSNWTTGSRAEVKRQGSWTRLTESKSWLFCLLTDSFKSLWCFKYLVCKVGIMIVPTSKNCYQNEKN